MSEKKVDTPTAEEKSSDKETVENASGTTNKDEISEEFKHINWKRSIKARKAERCISRDKYKVLARIYEADEAKLNKLKSPVQVPVFECPHCRNSIERSLASYHVPKCRTMLPKIHPRAVCKPKRCKLCN